MNSTAPKRTQQFVLTAVLTLAIIAFPADAWASASSVAGGAFTVIDNLISMLETLARPLMVLMIIIGGLTWAFTRNDEGMKTIGRVIIGLTIAVGATALASQLGFVGATF